MQPEPYFGSILSNKLIYLFLFIFYPTQLDRAGENQTQAGEREILENSPQSARVGLGVSGLC